MNSPNLFHLYLVLHVIGFTIMAGVTVAQFSVFARLNKALINNKQKALSILESTGGFARLMGIGAFLLILTGIAMVIYLHDGTDKMLWFRIKMPLVLLILLNGALFARPNANKMKKLLEENSSENDGLLDILKNRLSLFNVSQLLIFLTIFILSVFQF
jgi:hypothetical protein